MGADERLWPYSLRAAAVVGVLVFVVFGLVLFGLHQFSGFPHPFQTKWVIIGIAILAVLPLAFRVIDFLASRGATIEYQGFKLALVQAMESPQSSIFIATNVAIPGQPVVDSSTQEIINALRATRDKMIAVLDLESGHAWWETRLLVLASGAARLSQPNALVFLATIGGRSGQFCGWAELQAMCDALLSADDRYREHFDRASAAAAQWSLVEPVGQDIPAATPAWVTGLAQQYQWMAFTPDGRKNPLVLEQFLSNELGQYIEQLPNEPRHVTHERLKKLFEPILKTEHVDEQWEEKGQLTAFLKSSGRYVALTNGGTYKGLIHGDVAICSILSSLVGQRSPQ